MAQPRAILFDLYGTLLEADARSLHRGIARTLGVPPRQWLEFVRRDLLVRRFDEPAAFARHICDDLVPGHEPSLEQRCIDLVDHELHKVVPKEGVRSLLAFLRRRGWKLGLLSNLSSSFKEPLSRLGFSECFDAMLFSCDEGIAKPDARIYGTLLDRLGCAPAEAIFVGDSLTNDVEAPERLGMRGVHVGACAASHECIAAVSELGWFDFEAGPGARLLATGSLLPLAGRTVTVERIVPVDDEEQGRYNLVYEITACEPDGSRTTLFCKRFLLPESAYVEEFAYALHGALGLPTCQASVVEGREPFLAVACAPGAKYDGVLDAALAYEVGRHHVFAFLFSNADMRPRNAFVGRGADAPPLMTMVDLEHCFFNLAVDVSGLAHPERPQELEAMPADEIARRTGRKVLSERAMRRARKTFIETESCAPELDAAFRQGFCDQFRHAQSQRAALLDLLYERVGREPYLVIGTQAWRRAMGRVDVADIESRLALDPGAALAMFC